MRTIDDMLETYLSFIDKNVTLEEYLGEAGDEEKAIKKGLLYKEVIKLCLDEKFGIFYFMNIILGDMSEAGYPKPIRYNTLFRKFEIITKRYKHLAMECARTHGKSTFSYVYTLYRASLFKFNLIIIESASDKQAVKHFKKMRRIIDTNEFLIDKIMNKGQDTNNHLDYNGGYIEAYGFGAEIRGDHVDLIIVDDILRSDNKLSDQDIEDFMNEELEPMIGDRRGQIILIGTRKHETDIFGSVKQNVGWKSVDFPAIIDWEKKILQCPDRYTWEDMMMKMAIQGKRSFLKEYQNEFYSGAQSIFDVADIDLAKAKGKDFELVKKGDKDKYYVAAVDTARAGGVSSDFTVMIVLEIDQNSYSRKIAHMWRAKGKKIKYQVEIIANIANKFNDCTVLVETNNMGQEFIDQLIDDYNTDVEKFTTTSTGKGKKEDLIRLLVNTFENEKIIFPQRTKESRIQMEIIENELNKFQAVQTKAGNEQLKGVGAHDDCVIALALANKVAQTSGYAPAMVVERSENVEDNRMQSELEILFDLGIYK